MSDLRGRAALHEERGDYNSAESLLSELVCVADSEESLDRITLANDYYNLGMLNLALEQTDRAKKYLLRALAIQKSLFERIESDIHSTKEALADSLVEPSTARECDADDLLCARYVF